MPQQNAATLPANESKRLLALHRYRILDTPPEQVFDQITGLAARLFNVPIALVSLVDYDRIWFKSQYGTNLGAIERQPGLCASAILSASVYAVEDAPSDPRAFANELVSGDHGFRFYAAAPLRTHEGYNLGTLAIADTEPRSFGAEEKESLHSLAAIVMDEIELRLSARNAVKRHKDLLNTAAHDLKNPLLSISGFADEIIADAQDADIASMAGIIKRSSEQMLSIINELMQLARVENGVIKLDRAPVDLSTLVDEVVAENEVLARQKNQSITRTGAGQTIVCLDASRVREIVDNLLSNAVKYSPIGGKIEVSLHSADDAVTISVRDSGPGISGDDMELLFEKFSRLGSKPTANEGITGLGLAIVKSLTILHGGTVWAESDGPGKGSTFFVRLPRETVSDSNGTTTPNITGICSDPAPEHAPRTRSSTEASRDSRG